jgi:hypothetical protein
MFRRKRLLLVTLIVGAPLLVLAWRFYWLQWTPGKLILSKATTFVTEPLDDTGYPDYYAAINERMSRGVTPDNNAAVLLVQAFGPSIVPDGIDAFEVFLGLKIKPQPTHGSGKILVGTFFSNLATLGNIEQRAVAYSPLVRVGLALAQYQSENGTYPSKLSELSPRYMDTVPLDLFSGRPFRYRKTETGYRLYSVGQNLKDEGGKGPYDDNESDDLLIEVPWKPKPKPTPAEPERVDADDSA